ncbi:MAG: phospholipase D-like domain-containing protein [Anaerolineae bacterium]
MARVGLFAILLCLALGVASSALARPRSDAALYLPALSVRDTPDRPPWRPYTVYLPGLQVGRSPDGPRLRLSALYYDTAISGEPDESFEIWNLGSEAVSLLGWSVGDGAHIATFPDMAVPPRSGVWCAYSAAAFRFTFTTTPTCEYGLTTDPSLAHLSGAALHFTNTGGRVTLFAPGGAPADTLVYKAGKGGDGWVGEAVQPWHPLGFSEEGQILSRKRDETTGRPLADIGRASAWASDPADVFDGRRVRFPAWDMAAGQPFRSAVAAPVTVALAPDAAFSLVRDVLASATTSIDLEVYQIEHPALADLLAARAAAGVSVRVLLEGAPSGGLTDEDRWAATRIARAGGRVLYMAAQGARRPRFKSQHAKFAVIDGQRLLLGSENLTPDAMPDDDKGDGTLGRRGVVLVTPQPDLVAYAQGLFARDTDTRWGDLVGWSEGDAEFGPPPLGYQPPRVSGGIGYPAFATTPLTAVADEFELIQSPENSLRRVDGLIALLGRAGAGDTILVEELSEPGWWGAAGSVPEIDPNPRREALIAAARRGASVRVLLDRFFDDPRDPRSNTATCVGLNSLAAAEGLDLQCRTGNPTGLGIHNKMTLVRVSGEGHAHIGSLNGTEVSHKLNRELAVQFRSAAVYAYLASVFAWDWERGR